jgi:5-methylcytosine-specific restriction endonuclease McrBC GTP-binding regulatory subunit McrB
MPTTIQKVWEYWGNNYEGYNAGRSSSGYYYHILIDGWPPPPPDVIFYEFVVETNHQENIRVDFYAEHLGIYDQIETKLRSKKIEKILDKNIAFHPTQNNHGRVQLYFPLSSTTPETVCRYMEELINRTKDAITEVYMESIGQLPTEMEKAFALLQKKKQIILQGAPGVGKTYATKELALGVIEGKFPEDDDRDAINTKYSAAEKSGQFVFTTFHQSMDYEDFVEGYKPVESGDAVVFKRRDGPFKEICEAAEKHKDKKHVLIIDEINRGNVSKIFGELITLLETDKRGGEAEEVKARPTYSPDPFSIPHNLYIIGTMNTADRSLGQIDYALRRRFAFFTLKSDRSVIKKHYAQKNGDTKDKALALYDKVQKFFQTRGYVDQELESEDVMIGHSYFMANDAEDLQSRLDYEIIPLLKEYRSDGILSVGKNVLDDFLRELGK